MNNELRIGDTVIIHGQEYRIVKDRYNLDTERPGPYGSNGNIGVTVANDPRIDKTAWTVIKGR